MGRVMDTYAKSFLESKLIKKFGQKKYDEITQRMTEGKVRLRRRLNETSFVSRGNFVEDYDTMRTKGEDLLVANEDGVFARRSTFGKGGRAKVIRDEYYMLFRDGVYGSLITKNGRVESVVVENKYGLFCDLESLSDEEREGVLDRMLDVVEVMIDEDVLLCQ